jgi:hypothetical protein
VWGSEAAQIVILRGLHGLLDVWPPRGSSLSGVPRADAGRERHVEFVALLFPKARVRGVGRKPSSLAGHTVEVVAVAVAAGRF